MHELTPLAGVRANVELLLRQIVAGLFQEQLGTGQRGIHQIFRYLRMSS